ncbi:hypothetical protein ACVWWK_007075 [Bradyrhizobium sp. LB9.1b]
MHAAGDHVIALLGRAGIKGKDVTLAVTKQGHPCGFRKQRLGRKGGGSPALRFLVRQLAAVMRDGPTALTRPHFAAQKSQAGAIVCIHRQQRVQQHAVVIALADFPKPATALRCGLEVDLTGVLDRQNVAALDSCNRAFTPAFDDPLRCHLVMTEKAVEPHLQVTVSSRKLPQADILASNHASDKRRPPLSRRRSPNRPSVQSIRDSMAAPPSDQKCRHRDHTDSRFWNPSPSTRVNPSHQICACPRAFAGTTWSYPAIFSIAA